MPTSSSKTSIASAPIFSDSIASMTASVSMSSPRETLTMVTSSRILAMAAASMMLRVESMRGTCRVMTSELVTSVSMSRYSRLG